MHSATAADGYRHNTEIQGYMWLGGNFADSVRGVGGFCGVFESCDMDFKLNWEKVGLSA